MITSFQQDIIQLIIILYFFSSKGNLSAFISPQSKIENLKRAASGAANNSSS